jgi:hypothetical protein
VGQKSSNVKYVIPKMIRQTRANLSVPIVFCLLGLFSQPASASSVTLHPGDNVSGIVANSPAGTTFNFSPGVYRLAAPVTPKNSDAFVGAPGRTTILSGAISVSSFSKSGNYWAASLPFHYSNPVCAGQGCTCTANFPGCNFPESLFFDNKIWQRVPELTLVATGKWFWDLTAGKVYLADDPTGHQIEVGIGSQAFLGAASSVVINGLVIEKFAGEAIYARVPGGQSSHGWVVENSLLRFNHLAAITLGNQMQVLNNNICDNGKLGINGGGQGILVEGNEICRNNYAGFAGGQGGAKFDITTDLTVRHNFVHDNMGVGFHTDGGSLNTLYEYNHTMRNQGPAIDHEVSHAAIIRYNTIENDAYNPLGTSAYWGAGIWILSSDNVEVYGNTVTNSMNGIIGYEAARTNSQGTHNLFNLSVHENIITQQKGIAAGVISGSNPAFYPAVYTSWNNHFDNNTYCLSSDTRTFYDWQLKSIPKATWQGTYGQDQHSIWSCPTTPTVPAPN